MRKTARRTNSRTSCSTSPGHNRRNKNYLGVTRALSLAGVTDFSFVDEESRWKGSEVHRMLELYDLNRLDEKTVPGELRGYLSAHKKFMRETGFIPQHIEKKVQSAKIGVRGRLDRAGLMKGRRAIADLKTGTITEAVALQMALYGHLLDPETWWERIAIQLKSDGSYSMKYFPLLSWPGDLATALSVVRISHWKLANGLY